MATDKKYAIIGYGFVGKATEYFLKEKIEDNLEIYIEDPDLGYKVNNWAEIDYAFICVPTNLKNGKLDTSIIDKILSELYVGVQPIIRSTIGPDQAVQYANRGIIISVFSNSLKKIGTRKNILIEKQFIRKQKSIVLPNDKFIKSLDFKVDISFKRYILLSTTK